MHRLGSIILKDLLLLLRDRAGLFVTFLMPVAVLIVVTLVQDGAFRKVSHSVLTLAVIDEDRSAFSRQLLAKLEELDGIKVARPPAGAETFDQASASAALAARRCEAIITLPKGLGREALQASQSWARRNAALLTGSPQASDMPGARLPDTHRKTATVRLSFEPGVSAPHRAILRLAVNQVMQGCEMTLLMKAWTNELTLALASSDEAAPAAQSTPAPAYEQGAALALENPAGMPGAAQEAPDLLPDMVRFNVPAYAVFAVFFIVIPVSSCILRERRDGTLQRLRTLPVRPAELVLGKLLVFLGVALSQFGLMFVSGKWILPALGTGAFSPDAPLPLVLAMVACTAFAAVGFALVIASLATSHEQAGMVGAGSVVILAALGGVMVPVFYMPPIMRELSALTPLNWAVTAFQDVFARGAGASDVALRMALLLALGAACTTLAWTRLFRRS